jgi:hypothetical protein
MQAVDPVGGLGRNRTTDTRIFSVGFKDSVEFSNVPMRLISLGFAIADECPAFLPHPTICVVFSAQLHRNYTD